jgi:hypothetical protein|nr:MAG TPA_asm: Abi-like protein [Caudoviricetes sp.]
MKKLLTIDEQIVHLKSKGITFTYISEKDAKNYLEYNNNLFKLSSYRKNYRTKIVNGNIQYVSLDFAYLKDLAIIDFELRSLLLQMTIDIEHYVKLQLLRIFEIHKENGHSIVKDYFDSLSSDQKNIFLKELERSKSSTYCDGLYSKYISNCSQNSFDIPVWVFLELTTFGTLIAFYKICSIKYSDKQMLDNHYLLKTCKSIRNASAHNNCLLNDLRKSNIVQSPNHSMVQSIRKNIKSVSRSTLQNRLSNLRITQIITTFYTYNKIVTSNDLRIRRKAELVRFSARMMKHYDYYSNNQLIKSNFSFIKSMIDNFEQLV